MLEVEGKTVSGPGDINCFIYLFIYLFIHFCNVFFQLEFTPCKAKQPLRGMELQERKHKKNYRIQKICLEKTYS